MVKILIILLTGTVAGFLNTVAAGGTLIAMPVLIFLGLPSAVANGTNRIALILESIVGVTNFRRKGYFDSRFGLILGIPAVVGSIIGAKVAIELPDHVFNKIFALIMILVVGFIVWDSKRKVKESKDIITKKQKIISGILFFFVGIYGGVIQAGIGFIIILALTVTTDFSLTKINSLKVFVVAMYIIPSLLVFVVNGKVEWLLGLTLALGNGIGAYIGSNFAVDKGDKYIKVILIISVVIMAVKLIAT